LKRHSRPFCWISTKLLAKRHWQHKRQLTRQDFPRGLLLILEICRRISTRKLVVLTNKVCTLRIRKTRIAEYISFMWQTWTNIHFVFHIFAGCEHSSMFIYQSSHGMALLLIYVDDIIWTGSSSLVISNIIHQLRSKFDIKDLGDLLFFSWYGGPSRFFWFNSHTIKICHWLAQEI
jgi:hypothetical protein